MICISLDLAVSLHVSISSQLTFPVYNILSYRTEIFSGASLGASAHGELK